MNDSNKKLKGYKVLFDLEHLANNNPAAVYAQECAKQGKIPTERRVQALLKTQDAIVNNNLKQVVKAQAVKWVSRLVFGSVPLGLSYLARGLWQNYKDNEGKPIEIIAEGVWDSSLEFKLLSPSELIARVGSPTIISFKGQHLLVRIKVILKFLLDEIYSFSRVYRILLRSTRLSS
jgi:hypothetical protein